jgi:hypothetical protein
MKSVFKLIYGYLSLQPGKVPAQVRATERNLKIPKAAVGARPDRECNFE